MIITQALHNKYTKTQSYMQYGTMLVKNLVERLGVHDKTDHTLVSQVTLTLSKIIGRSVRVTLFCKNASTMSDRHKLEGALKLGVFTHKAQILKNLLGPLPPDSGSTQKKLQHANFIYELYKTHNSSIILKIILTYHASK